MKKLILIALFFSIYFTSSAQSVDSTGNSGIEFYVHEEVSNADGEVEQEQELIQL